MCSLMLREKQMPLSPRSCSCDQVSLDPSPVPSFWWPSVKFWDKLWMNISYWVKYKTLLYYSTWCSEEKINSHMINILTIMMSSIRKYTLSCCLYHRNWFLKSLFVPSNLKLTVPYFTIFFKLTKISTFMLAAVLSIQHKYYLYTWLSNITEVLQSEVD